VARPDDRAALAEGSQKEDQMSLMDKMKEQAAQALTKAQQGVSQGKAKIDEAQARHQWDGLLRNLGQALYAEQREGGSSDAVAAALAALDAQATRLRAEGGDGSSDRFTGGGAAEESDSAVPAQEGEQMAAGAGTVDTEEGPGNTEEGPGNTEEGPGREG
jgi:hypothetical protein